MQNKLDAQKALNAELQAKRDNLLSAKSQGTKERAFNDQLRHIKHNLATEGQTTLDNGAVVKYVTSGSDSFVTIEAPEGNFSIDVSAVKGGSSADAATKLLKAYREHNADQYKVDVLPGQPEPTDQPQPEQEPQPASHPDPRRLVNIAMRSNLARRVLVRFLKEIKLYLTVLIRLIRITNMLVTESLRMTAN